MITIYDIKPKFQNLLRPIVKKLHDLGVTPNAVTLFTFALSVMYGFLFLMRPTCARVLSFFPVVLFLRMALNAVDGMLAKIYQQASPLGALLNEICDMGSDAGLFLPFALVPGIHASLVVILVLLAVISEAAGLCGLLIGASRRYDGPMGKSDRAFALSLIAMVLVLFDVAVWVNGALMLMIGLLLLTIGNRCYQALQEVGCIDAA
jgi:CDP-diacylglycerol---glycerol-3-phosphate 3-phosphatidyltransferase